jgi:type VI secretion system protein ImpL
VRITGVTFDGKQVEFFNEPGRFGLEKMINAAQRKRVDAQIFELHWGPAANAVGVQLRIISNAATPTPAPPPAPAGNGGTPPAGSASRPGALPAIIAGQDDGSFNAAPVSQGNTLQGNTVPATTSPVNKEGA